MITWKNDDEMFSLMKEKLYTPVVGDIIDQMTARGLLVYSDGRLACTEAGFPLLNSILVEFLPETENTLAPQAGE